MKRLAEIIGHTNFLFLADSKASEQRLLKAEKALASLASKPGQDALALQEKVDRILKHHRVSEDLLVAINKQIRYPKVYQGSGRPSPERPCRRVRQTILTLNYQRQETEIAKFSTLAGWRLYVTNAPTERLSLEEAVSYYREQWQPERGFHLFKRGRLPALPIYFQDESRIRGLMFLLAIALRLFTLMETATDFAIDGNSSVYLFSPCISSRLTHLIVGSIVRDKPSRTTTQLNQLLFDFNGAIALEHYCAGWLFGYWVIQMSER